MTRLPKQSERLLPRPATPTRPQPRQAPGGPRAVPASLASLPQPARPTWGGAPLSLRTALQGQGWSLDRDVARGASGSNQVARPSTSTIAPAKACGASCGRLCPMLRVMTRWALFAREVLGMLAAPGCGAPMASPSGSRLHKDDIHQSSFIGGDLRDRRRSSLWPWPNSWPGGASPVNIGHKMPTWERGVATQVVG